MIQTQSQDLEGREKQISSLQQVCNNILNTTQSLIYFRCNIEILDLLDLTSENRVFNIACSCDFKMNKNMK